MKEIFNLPKNFYYLEKMQKYLDHNVCLILLHVIGCAGKHILKSYTNSVFIIS